MASENVSAPIGVSSRREFLAAVGAGAMILWGGESLFAADGAPATSNGCAFRSPANG